IAVSDTGIGIPAEQLSRIFMRFHQVDGSSTRRYGGVGLGLAIVKSILDAHGATIRVDSQVGRGTTFRFRLPQADAAEGRAAEAAGGRLPVEEGLVLVIDDDPAVLRMMKNTLEPAGLAVVSAATAAEGGALARERRPDVILLDLLLPDRSGFDLLQALKDDPDTRHIPVMIVSVSSDAARGLTLGAADYMLKPLDRRAIVATVSRLASGSVTDGEPVVLIVDDEQDTAEMLRDTLRHEGFHTMVAHDGRQAMEVVARKRPHLVVLDLMMPEMDGFAVLQALHADPATARIPVLVLTARGSEDDRRRGLALGARSYMSKPFEVRALLAEVRRHITQEPAAGRASV
ncbi:MAG TPA: response regulator, partial [Vicinamibacteria bacterium]|nr:response regulator [Vicinamibacteria bacterium]